MHSTSASISGPECTAAFRYPSRGEQGAAELLYMSAAAHFRIKLPDCEL